MPSADLPTRAWPTVSVVIPTHGRPQLVRDAINAVVGQDYPGLVETVVVHDAEPADHALASSDERRVIKVIENSHVQGLTGVRNSGLEVATGELIGWCDDDDIWDSDKLTRQINLLNATRGAWAVGSGYRWLLPTGHVWSMSPPKERVSKRDVLTHGNSPLGLHSSTVLIRRGAYEELGAYDETLPESRCEDLEFFLRLTNLGPIPVLREPVANIRFDPFSEFSAQRRRTIAETLQLLLERYPEFDQMPVAKARMCYRIAADYSDARMHNEARLWAWRATRLNPMDRRSAGVLAASVLRLKISRIQRISRRARLLSGRAPMNRALRGHQ